MTLMALSTPHTARVGAILTRDTTASAVLDLVARMTVPDAWLVAGAVMGTVFNALTDRPSGYGITDWDIAYCDPSDLSKEGEITVARQTDALREQAGLHGVKLDVVNQARVHLWYEQWYGGACPAYLSTAEAVARYSAYCACVGARRPAPGAPVEVMAPHGLDDLLALRVCPNPVQAPRAVYEGKAARWRYVWPELLVDVSPP